MYWLSVKDSFRKCKSSKEGLTYEQAEERLKANGYNKLKETKKKTLFSRFIEQLKNIMIIVLIIAAVISFVVSKIEGESYTESLVIFAIVILNALLGVVQEAKADKAIEALKKMSLPYIRVRRNGKLENVKTEELVVGDIVLLEAGDFVPADMRMIESNSLRVDEAALTGESVSVGKHIDTLKENIPLADRRNMVYSGSSVVYGRGEGVVVATGMDTELGKIATILTDTKEGLTPLQKKMNEISKALSVVVVVIGLIMVITGIFKGQKLLEIFMLSISLAVAAIPEGLPAAITIILSIGVQKMSKENSIVRKMSSIETLGATEVICSDKTGTLTQNKMTVTEMTISTSDKIDFDKLTECMVFCNDTKYSLTQDEANQITEQKLLGDPTETALVSYAHGFGINKEKLEEKCPRVAEVPFDSNRKMMTTINKNGNAYTIYTKGAVESIISRCTRVLKNGVIVEINEEMRQQILKDNVGLTSKALRVLAFAYRDTKTVPKVMESSEVERDLIYIGLVGMIDPARKEVSQAVQECYEAGMTPIMITGDNKETAVAIAKQIGILKEGFLSITGSELDNMSDDEFEKNIEKIRVYARVSPENKVRIVKMFKKIGKTVAMTGDGVNDAPALKNADIGVGMGITGTEVSKSVASMVLTDDNFASIVVAVKEGRRIYTNIQNVIAYLLASNIAEVIIVFIATLFNSQVFSPIQLLWINLVSDAIPAITLGYEPAEKNIMKRKPRKANENFFNAFLITRIVIPAVIKSVMVLLLYFFVETSPLYEHKTAMTVAFIALSFSELLFAFVMRSDTKSIFKIGILTNKPILVGVGVTLIIQLAVIFTPAAEALLGLVNLTPSLYLLSIGSALTFFVIAEITKVVLAKCFKKS